VDTPFFRKSPVGLNERTLRAWVGEETDYLGTGKELAKFNVFGGIHDLPNGANIRKKKNVLFDKVLFLIVN